MMKQLMIILLFLSAVCMAQEKLPEVSPDPNGPEAAKPAQDLCSKENIKSNLEISKAAYRLYYSDGKPIKEITFNKEVWEWAESAHRLFLGCYGNTQTLDPAFDLMWIEVKALMIQRGFLISGYARLSDYTDLLQKQLAASSVSSNNRYDEQVADARREEARTAAAQEAKNRRDFLVGMYLLNQTRYQPYQLPMPQVPQPRQSLNCTTRYIGNTAYTDCQ